MSKQRRFFIFSLPRSGSSWLSMFLSQPGCYCYHEPFADGDLDHLYERWAARPEPCVGAIDTSAHQRPGIYVANCKGYVLRRNISGVLASLRRKGYSVPIDAEVARLESAAVGCIPIYYERLHDIQYLASLWIEITGRQFDHERAIQLVDMNIQRIFAAVEARVAAHRDDK